MNPLPQIDVFSNQPIHLPQEDSRAFIIHGLQLLHRTHRISVRHRSLESLVHSLIPDAEDGRNKSRRCNAVKHLVKVTFVELGRDTIDLRDEGRIRQRDMVGSNPDERAVSLVKVKMVVHLQTTSAGPDAVDVRYAGEPGSWDVTEAGPEANYEQRENELAYGEH